MLCCSEEALVAQQQPPLSGVSRPKSARSSTKLGKGGNPIGRALTVVRTLLTGASTILPPWSSSEADPERESPHGGPALTATRVHAGESRFRCGRGEPSPDSDVGGVSPLPVLMRRG